MTTTTARIAHAVGRLETALHRNARFGAGTSRSVTRTDDGLRCTTEEGPWRVDSDLPAALGGTADAPTPSVLLRAALGSCMAMSYRLHAARHGVELGAITVIIEADAEIAGMLRVDATAPPGFTEVRYHVEVVTEAPRDIVLRILDEGDHLSPLLDVFTRVQSVRRTVAIETSR